MAASALPLTKTTVGDGAGGCNLYGHQGDVPEVFPHIQRQKSELQIRLSQVRRQWPCAIGKGDGELLSEGTDNPILPLPLPPKAPAGQEEGSGDFRTGFIAHRHSH